MDNVAYHILKDSFVGDSIYPLNLLKNFHPEIYEKEVRKYEGREKLLEARNPILDCLWNDVVQFSCLDPRITFEAVKSYNPAIGTDEPIRWCSTETQVLYLFCF